MTYKIDCKEQDFQEPGTEHDISLRKQIVTLSCVGIGYSNFSKGIM